MKKVLQKAKNNIFYICICAILVLYVLSMLYFLGWALMTTLRPYSDFIGNPVSLPSKISFQNWSDTFINFSVPVFKDGHYVTTYYMEGMLVVSLVYSIGCALVQTFTSCVCAYLTAKYSFRLGKIVYAIVIITMIIPIVGSLPSEMMMMQRLGLYDTFIGVFVMKMNFLGMYFLVFYASFKSLSWEYAESAFIDGASHLTVMMRIMLPLVRTSFLAIFLLNFIGFWNDYQTPMLYIPSYPTMAYGLFYMKFIATQGFGKVPMQLTGCIILAIPSLVLFIIFRDKLMGNLTVGGIKG